MATKKKATPKKDDKLYVVFVDDGGGMVDACVGSFDECEDVAREWHSDFHYGGASFVGAIVMGSVKVERKIPVGEEARLPWIEVK